MRGFHWDKCEHMEFPVATGAGANALFRLLRDWPCQIALKGLKSQSPFPFFGHSARLGSRKLALITHAACRMCLHDSLR